ncbi:MAG: D-alanyl-D-alanine carboxypeptidase family protein [Thermoleophilia bacterium]
METLARLKQQRADQGRCRTHPRTPAVFVLLLFIALVGGCGRGDGAQTTSASAATTEKALLVPQVQAAAGIVIDRATGTVLWQKDAHSRRPPASLTKVMAAIVVLERIKNLDSWCTVPRAVAAPEIKVVIGLRPGQRITVREALRATLIKSANDTTVTLAHRVAGSETAFVRLMNRKARTLGMRDTHFVNSRGMPATGQYSTAADLALLGQYAMSNASFRNFCRQKSATIRWPGHSARVVSKNRLLNYSWGNGIKTGSTTVSGRCLLGSGKYELRPLILVTLQQPTRNAEEHDAVALFRWADAQYERRHIVDGGDLVTIMSVANGGELRVVAAATLSRVVRSAAKVSVALELPATPLAETPPLGTKLGRVTYSADGQKLGSVNLLADGLVDSSPSPLPSELAVQPRSGRGTVAAVQ